MQGPQQACPRDRACTALSRLQGPSEGAESFSTWDQAPCRPPTPTVARREGAGRQAEAAPSVLSPGRCRLRAPGLLWDRTAPLDDPWTKGSPQPEEGAPGRPKSFLTPQTPGVTQAAQAQNTSHPTS